MKPLPKFIVNVECAIEGDNKFLLIRRPQGVHAEGLLSFPGGKFEVADGEGSRDVLIQAVRREVYEEVGLELPEAIYYVTSSCFVDSKNNTNVVVDVIFHCKIDSVPAELNVSNREVPEYHWLTYDEIVRASNCPEWLVRYLDDASTRR